MTLNITETKLSLLEHPSKVITLYGYKIQNIERNLSTVGFFERRKMQKEIVNQEKLRNDYQKDSIKKYFTKTQLQSKKSMLIREKMQIENVTGITAACELEQQQK